MTISASLLKQNFDKIIDQMFETGISVEVEKNGKKLKIIPIKKTSRFTRLKKRKIMKCDPEELVHLDWSSEWKI